MRKKNYKEVENKKAVLMDGTPVDGVMVRWLIDTHDGAKRFAMRRFEIEGFKTVPLHVHPEDHEIYILEGKGKFFNDKGDHEIASEGDVLYIPPNEKHGIENLSADNLTFLCLIPYLKS
jgi:quercetin dioxygenase-like cupin family protein